MSHIRKIELLSPAKDLQCGIEAVNHGADAVYIGAPKFGARAAAGNTLEDIHSLCEYAHLFGVRIYVALNTILKEEELEEVKDLVWKLYDAGVDALIVQDMALMKMDLPPIPLHASTQTDNRSVEKVRFLQDAGFTQVVLARELSLAEIRKIADSTQVALEVFVHGALCVSYSGQCYLSEAMYRRSANRGECAQCCRLPYTMLDSEGKEIAAGKYLLSLRDMNRADDLEALLDAGVSSLKIEGRLKDVSYVKNITALYRQKLDGIFARRPSYIRASIGHSRLSFTPRADKSFNRGFTPFFLNGRVKDITAFDSPKSQGEFVGMVKGIKGNSFTIAGSTPLNNGDGLAFFNGRGEMEGFRVNRVDGNRVYPQDMPAILPKTALYRNFDQQFEKLLSKPSAERKIGVDILFEENGIGFTVEMKDEGGYRIAVVRSFPKELAKFNQTENIKSQLSRLGNTPFEVKEISISMKQDWFMPSSILAEMRREAVGKLLAAHRICYQRELSKRNKKAEGNPYPLHRLTYLGNVSNSLSRTFYHDHGVGEIDAAFELNPLDNEPLMFSKHCLKYSMGWCPNHQKGKSPYKEPYYLQYKDTRLLLQFDCKNCRMLVLKSSK